MAFEHGVELRLIPSPGKPTQNEFIERFNARFRDECLNEHWFSDIAHTRKTINDWRQDYHECHSHSSLDYQMPAEFAARLKPVIPDYDWSTFGVRGKLTGITN